MEKNGYAVGEIVYIKKYRMVGEIIGRRGSQYELQAGSFTFLVDGTDLSKADEEATSNYVKEKQAAQAKANKDPYVRKYYRPREFRIDLHGFTIEQAKIAIKETIEEAKLYRAHHAFIVHGKGTGTLRRMVQRLLRHYKETGIIEDYEYAAVFDGGHGVTIVYF